VRIVEESPLLVLFDGPTLADSGITTQPPDPVIAASATHIVIMVNRTIATYRRSDLPGESLEPVECMTFTDFFGFGGAIFDPRIVYDQNAERFVASAQGAQFGSAAALHLAHSEDGDLSNETLSSWAKAVDEMGNNLLEQGFTDAGCQGGTEENMALDQPGLGYDDFAWYVAAPLTDPDPFGNPVALDSAIWVVPKPEEDGPDPYPVRGRDFVDDTGAALGCLDVDLHSGGIQAPRPAEAIGTGAAAAPAGYLVGFSDEGASLDFGDPGDPDDNIGTFNHLRLYAVVDPLAGPAGVEPRFFELPVPAYEAPLNDAGRPRRMAAEAPSGETFVTIDARITNAAWREVMEAVAIEFVGG